MFVEIKYLEQSFESFGWFSLGFCVEERPMSCGRVCSVFFAVET